MTAPLLIDVVPELVLELERLLIQEDESALAARTWPAHPRPLSLRG